MKHTPFHTKKAKNYNGLKNHKKSASGFFFAIFLHRGAWS